MAVGSMFGEFFHNIDAKGRLSVPAKFRDSLGSTVVISQGPEKCLRIYALSAWEEVIEELSQKIKTSTPEGRKLFRRITAKSSVCDIDAQGRIIITPNLREYAEIIKEVAIIGNGNKAEVWNREKYDEMFGDDGDDATFEEMLADLDVDL